MLLPVAAILSTTTSSNSSACTQQPNGSKSSGCNNICDKRSGEPCRNRSAVALNASCSCTLTLATAGVRLDWVAVGCRRWARRRSSAKRRRRKRRKSSCNWRRNNSNQHSDVESAAGNCTTISRGAVIATTTETTTALRYIKNIAVIKRNRRIRIGSRTSSNSGRIANYISCCMPPKTSATTTTISSSIATASTINATTTTKKAHKPTSSGKANSGTVAPATAVHQQQQQQQQQLTQQQWPAQPKQNQLKQQQGVPAERLTIKQVSSAAEKHRAQQLVPKKQQKQLLTAIPTKIARRKFDYLIACSSRATTPAPTTSAITSATTVTTTVTTTAEARRRTNHFGSTAFSAACTLLLGTLFALSPHSALQISTASGPHSNQNMQNSQELLLQYNSSNNNNNNNNNVSYNMSANEYNGRRPMPLEIPMDMMNSSSSSSSGSSDVRYSNNNNNNNNNTFKSLSIIDGLTAATETNQLPAFDFGMPRNITARTGQTEAIIKCRVDRLDDKSVSWIRKRDLHILTVGTATYTSDKRFQVTESKDSREWTLHVKAPQARDSGIYECQVNTEPKVSMAFQLNIIEISPDSRAIINGPADLHFKVGSAIILSCHVQQPSVKDIGPIYWYRGEHIITPFDADAVDDGGGSDDRANSAITGAGTATVAATAADTAMQHDDIATNDITQDFTTRIAMESQLGDTLKSRLRISNAQTTDTGNYTCQPTTASSASVMVHVINDENPAAMQKSSANALYRSPATTTTIVLLTTITLITKAASTRALQTAALLANTCRRLYSKHRRPHRHQQQPRRQHQHRLLMDFVVDIAVLVVVVIIAGAAAAAAAAAAANLETAAVAVAAAALTATATAVVVVIAVVTAGSQVGKCLVATLLIVAANVSALVVATVPLSGCVLALLTPPVHALPPFAPQLTLLLALAMPLFVVSASRIILR